MIPSSWWSLGESYAPFSYHWVKNSVKTLGATAWISEFCVDWHRFDSQLQFDCPNSVSNDTEFSWMQLLKLVENLKITQLFTMNILNYVKRDESNHNSNNIAPKPPPLAPKSTKSAKKSANIINKDGTFINVKIQSLIIILLWMNLRF